MTKTSTSKDLSGDPDFASGAIYGLAAIPVSMLLLYLYRKVTDECTRKCKTDKKCYYKCNEDAATEMIKRIDKDVLMTFRYDSCFSLFLMAAPNRAQVEVAAKAVKAKLAADSDR